MWLPTNSSHFQTTLKEKEKKVKKKGGGGEEEKRKKKKSMKHGTWKSQLDCPAVQTKQLL